jgi:hypothetical protein
MKRQLILEQWNEFSKLIPKNAPEVQRKEMKRAFYFGAQSILFKVIAVLAPESEPTQEDIQIMVDLDQELQEFAKRLNQGLE